MIDNFLLQIFQIDKIFFIRGKKWDEDFHEKKLSLQFEKL